MIEENVALPHSPENGCRMFWVAQRSGKDKEGYGPAIYKTESGYEISSYLPWIDFCPWCGIQVVMEEK